MSQPAELISVQANDPGIGQSSLTEIESAVASKRHRVRMVVAQAGQVIQDALPRPAVLIDAADASRIAPFGEIKPFIVKRQSVDRRTQILHKKCAPAFRLEAPDSTSRRHAVE